MESPAFPPLPVLLPLLFEKPLKLEGVSWAEETRLSSEREDICFVGAFRG